MNVPRTVAGLVPRDGTGRRGRARQGGMGLVELMVSITISLILMAGLMGIVFGTKENFTVQNQLAQLQDNERMAMSILTNVVQNAGYFASATTQSASTALPATGSFASAGQGITGTAGTATSSDQIAIRYLAGTSDGVADCLGATNASGANQMDVNLIYVDTVKQQLVCSVQDGAAAAVTTVLASGVSGMSVWYGVTAGGTSAVQYLPAAGMTAANWNSVVSVKLVLSFVPPASTTGAKLLPSSMTVSLTRVIDLLNRV